MKQHGGPLGDHHDPDLRGYWASAQPASNLRVAVGEQEMCAAHGHDNDRGGDLAATLNSFGFRAGVEADLFGGSHGKVDSDRITLVEDDCDGVLG